MPIACIGVDLAWSGRNPSGLALLGLDQRGRLRLVETARLETDAEIVRWIEARRARTTVLAIDAPLIAPNPGGTGRPCDGQLTSAFGRYHAGTYPANAPKCVRPVALRKKLARLGYDPDPVRVPRRRGLWQIEVYPHPAQVVLFGLKRILKYKKGTPAERRRGLRQLATRIRRDLARKRPQLTANGELRQLLAPRGVLRGGALKDWEDRLDAVVCGYIAAYYWWWGEKRCRVFGDDWRRGYIVTPWPPAV